MTDISSISFSQCSMNMSPTSSKSATIQLDNLLSRLGVALQQVRQLNETGIDIYIKLASLVQESQYKLNEVKRQNLQAHRKCLQHIQILLYQQDYSSALMKIDRYKKMELKDLSFMVETNVRYNDQENKDNLLAFQQEKAFIDSPFTDFQIKQKMWLKYALEDQDLQENLQHVTYEEVEKSLLEHFRKQFDIVSEMTQNLQINKERLQTPEKKNYKSMSMLKSSTKNNKISGSNAKVKNLIYQKSAGKLATSPKKTSEKRTTRKKANKQNQQNKTNKKSTTFLV